jgi:hypothetical protein
VRTKGARAFVGRQWLPGGPFAYAAADVAPETWEHYAEAVRAPAGFREAQVWLLNFKSSGRASFDDVVFAELGRVDMSACPDAGTRAPCGPPLRH